MIEVEDVPELRDPVMILAFEGWNDAGEAATGVVEHMADLWDAQPVAVLDPEDYYDFQVNRPRVYTENGERRIHWRTTRIHVVQHPDLPRDLILVRGVEPSFRWRAFALELISFATEFGADTMILLGALMADVAHTRPIPVTSYADDEATVHRFDLDRASYEGPTGIVGVIAEAAVQAGITAISSWAAVPHYAGHGASPKAVLALIETLERLIAVPIDRLDLVEQSQEWEATITELANEDDEVHEYVEALEQAQDTAGLPEASGDAIAKEFERYLRRHDDDSGGKEPPTARS
ncbi:PAC2 family protein [Kribbia dieselivorans]|uniref:PAC2 family protein n=1 Tax=Kribbia dieselivorans TaxID=331526 RepID=UPI0008390101|nr:PAC2 family protein [Kribbia dieselivorans]